MVTFSKLGQYGRFGNQLWQIASTIGIGFQNKMDFAFPEWGWQKYFPNKLPTADKKSTYKTYLERGPYYQEVKLNSNADWELRGYFQSWKYFDHCRDLIHKYLYFPKLSLKGVAVHIRRGDYLSLQHVHPVLPIEYYEEAFKLFKGEIFTIISDDMEWCREQFVGDKFQFYEFASDWSAFSWMASYNKIIIANSSFSWWAAYLAQAKEVVAPKTWVYGEDKDDRVPPEWIRI